ncbi:MAG: NAD(+)/NADH kinase [Methanoregulaceae archaeon]|nr:NAD(+)/NADH kinase [Methanoregulaceae archaeon]
MEILLVSRIDDPNALGYSRGLGDFLRKSGHSVRYEIKTGKALGVRPEGLLNEAEIAVIVGGDGTILHTIQRMQPQIPVLGINWGEVGFLADLEPDEAEGFLSGLSSGYPVETRMRISFTRDDEPLGDALNEALIVTSRPAKMLRFLIMIDGVPAERFRADGILISTPTGSTAYAMSAGGPIVDPRIEGFLLVPLAPYLLSSRPHLISCDRPLEIRLESAKPAQIVIDGQKSVDLGSECTIRVRRSEEPALFVDAGRNFFAKVNEKLRRL